MDFEKESKKERTLALVMHSAELVQLAGEINRGPEKDAVKILTTDRADQPFHKSM